MRSCIILAIAVGAALLGSACWAVDHRTAYSNFSSDHEGWGYNYDQGWFIVGKNVNEKQGQEHAFRFMSAASGIVSDIWVPIWTFGGYPDSKVTLRLARARGALPPQPEDVMETWTITDFRINGGHYIHPTHLIGNGGSRLEQGQAYWLWAAGADRTLCVWGYNSDPHLLLPHTVRTSGWGWRPITDETASTFRVDVVIPEPAMLAFLAAGVLALLGRRRSQTWSSEL